MAQAERLRTFEPVELPDPPSAAEKAATAFAASAVSLALKTLSQRAITATKDIFTLLSVASAFLLWWSIPNPTVTQIVSLSIYAVFVLAANIIVRRA